MSTNQTMVSAVAAAIRSLPDETLAKIAAREMNGLVSVNLQGELLKMSSGRSYKPIAKATPKATPKTKPAKKAQKAKAASGAPATDWQPEGDTAKVLACIPAGQSVKVSDIAAEVGMAAKACGQRLKLLRKHGLVTMSGDRRGALWALA